MYLNDEDVVVLLRKRKSALRSGAARLCRETTEGSGFATPGGDYQAVYRSIDRYTHLLRRCGLFLERTKVNCALRPDTDGL